MEDIPNKVRDILGIIVDVNLLPEEGKDYLEIKVAPSTYPVNYKGEYYYRSGSTKQMLKGAALTEFLTTKTGHNWDDVPVDHVSIKELDNESFDIFRKNALQSQRMDEMDLRMSDEQLLDRLGLIEHGNLNRAAVLLFHRNPEWWIKGAYIKVGFFESDAEILYQDEIHGSLFVQAEKIMDLLFSKYLKAEISYNNVTRVERYPFPKAAIREAVYNAIIHRNYASQIPIQISVYENKLYISNDCVLPIGWTVETLMYKHRSKPFNPSIANGFFRAGFVETWGRGIEKICQACKEYEIPEPEYTVYPEDITVLFQTQETKRERQQADGTLNGTLDGTLDGTLNDTLDKNQKDVILMLTEEPNMTQKDISEKLKLSLRQTKRIMKGLAEAGMIERSGGRRFGYWKVLLDKTPY